MDVDSGTKDPLHKNNDVASRSCSKSARNTTNTNAQCGRQDGSADIDIDRTYDDVEMEDIPQEDLVPTEPSKP
jgi:hypothetical protein